VPAGLPGLTWPLNTKEDMALAKAGVMVLPSIIFDFSINIYIYIYWNLLDHFSEICVFSINTPGLFFQICPSKIICP
jgi:hypothetical protein